MQFEHGFPVQVVLGRRQ